MTATAPDWTIPPVEPTDDPKWYRMVEECDDDCHHPVHAFGNPERLRHLIEANLAEFALERGWIEDAKGHRNDDV